MTTSDATLHGRSALITGGGTGIGAATATAIAAAGASVTITGRRRAPLARIAASIGATIAEADVTDPGAIDRAVELARTTHGPLDLVVANAGAMLPAPFVDADPQEWHRMIEVNVLGVLNTARAALPDLLGAAQDGRPADLVLVSSIGAHLVMDDYAVYMASKAAVTHLARNLRSEVGRRGVRVRVVEPGMTQSDLASDASDEAALQRLADLGRLIPPIPAERVGRTVAWSCALPADTNVAAVEILPTVQG